MLETQMTIADLADLADAKKLRRRLDYVYSPVPAFSCYDGCSACCFNSAETYNVEFANIVSYLKKLPADHRSKIIRRTVLFEFLHLVTLDFQCPFLEEGRCAVYEVRPLQCRFFGLYPDSEYDEQKETSRESNVELVRLYKQHKTFNLDESVVAYDIDQCDAARQGAAPKIMSSAEREMVQDRLLTIENETFPENSEFHGHERFTLLYCADKLSEEEMSRLRLSAMNEYREAGTHEILDSMIALGTFDL